MFFEQITHFYDDLVQQFANIFALNQEDKQAFKIFRHFLENTKNHSLSQNAECFDLTSKYVDDLTSFLKWSHNFIENFLPEQSKPFYEAMKGFNEDLQAQGKSFMEQLSKNLAIQKQKK